MTNGVPYFTPPTATHLNPRMQGTWNIGEVVLFAFAYPKDRDLYRSAGVAVAMAYSGNINALPDGLIRAGAVVSRTYMEAHPVIYGCAEMQSPCGGGDGTVIEFVHTASRVLADYGCGVYAVQRPSVMAKTPQKSTPLWGGGDKELESYAQTTVKGMVRKFDKDGGYNAYPPIFVAFGQDIQQAPFNNDEHTMYSRFGSVPIIMETP